ncbi:MAG: hypothetical protein EXR85_01820 [Xanthomonadales bacterium]|nr:hypothetical protein [Xanthomonadales bacterium]
MEAWLQQWLSLLLRWAHFITGIAWIGASFYFNWLENHLQRRAQSTQDASPAKADPIAGDPIAGDLWAVHDGGFYYLQKYRVAPQHLPEPLHWFKYEAYFTWVTGLALLIVVYYWDARLFMLDPSVSGISTAQAIALGVSAMLVSWLVYDGLCRSRLRRHTAWQGALIAAWFVLLAYVLSHYLSGRAAFIHVGAAMGTVMVANVFFVIIPAQKELVAALAGGRTPDASKGNDALLRSRHNNYFTLPVLFMMISSHYPATYSGVNNWLFLAVFSLSVVGIRHWFNVRHLPQHSKWVLPAAVLVMFCLMLASMPRQGTPSGVAGQAAGLTTAPTTLQIMPVITARCAGCHSGHPTVSGITTAPLAIAFDTADEVEAQAERIFQAAVVNRTMPLGNLTTMSDAEREQLAQWYAGLAKKTP